jgi:hypothetical protein
VVFADQAMKVRIVEIESGKVTPVDQNPQYMATGGLESWRFAWSPDSRGSRTAGAVSAYGVNAIFIVDTRDGRRRN